MERNSKKRREERNRENHKIKRINGVLPRFIEKSCNDDISVNLGRTRLYLLSSNPMEASLL